MRKIIRFFWALLFSSTLVMSAVAHLEGSAPFGITSEIADREYQRVFHHLSAEGESDSSQVTILFIPKREMLHTFSLPEWGGGGAVGKNTVVIPTDVSPLFEKDPRKTMVHELVHIAIARIADTVFIPRFFHEGAALLLSGDISFREQSVLSTALLMHSLFPIMSIDSVNYFSRFAAEIAYYQSRQVALYLTETYGFDVLGVILDSTVYYSSFDKGLNSSCGISIHELDSQSHERIVKRYMAFFWLLENYYLWLFIVFLFIAGYIRTVIRTRKKKAALFGNEDDGDEGYIIAEEETPPKE